MAAGMAGEQRSLTLEERRGLVKTSAERAERARRRWQELEYDAYAKPEDRAKAKQILDACEHEFGWQWENVLTILRGGGM